MQRNNYVFRIVYEDFNLTSIKLEMQDLLWLTLHLHILGGIEICQYFGSSGNWKVSTINFWEAAGNHLELST